MITYADLIAAHPEAKAFPEAIVNRWIASANNGMPDDRFKGTPDKGRMLFVMHNLTKPALPTKVTTAVATRSNAAGRARAAAAAKTKARKKPHPWASTPHGQRLMKAVNY